MGRVLQLLLLAACLGSIAGFYFPLKAPVTYCTEETENCKQDIPIYANRISSIETVITYEYNRFDFCAPEKETSAYHANFGQILSGDRINNTPYKLQFKEDVECEEVCARHYKAGQEVDESKLNFTKDAIFQNYYNNWIADDLPVSWCYTTVDGNEYCSMGFPLGCHVTSKGLRSNACVMDSRYGSSSSFYLFNHLDIEVEYSPTSEHSDTASVHSGRILAVKLKPASYKSKCSGDLEALFMPDGPLLWNVDIPYTYSVKWKENQEVGWSSRWDMYDTNNKVKVMAFSMLNSVILLLFLGFLVVTMVLRIYNKCIYTKTKVAVKWKALYPYVFLPPKHLMFLSVLCGSGLQLFLAALFTGLMATIGIAALANRGSIVLCLLGSFTAMGMPAGYTAARFYKTYGGQQPVLQTALLSILCPGISLLLFLVMDTLQRFMGSSAAAPFSAHLTLFGFWSGSTLFTVVGAFFGYRKGANHVPCKPDMSEIPPKIPAKRIWHRLFSIMLLSIGAAGVIYIPIFFILTTVWLEQYFVHFGYYIGHLTLLALMTILLSMFLTFAHLNTKDYQWLWRAFLSVAFTGPFLFFYCVYFYFAKSQLQDGISMAVYLGYSFLFNFYIFLACGALGLTGSSVFVAKIYSLVQKNIEENPDYDPAETLM